MPVIIHSGINEMMNQINAPTSVIRVKNLVDVIGCPLAGANTGNKSAILPHVVRNLVGVEDNGNVEVREKR